MNRNSSLVGALFSFAIIIACAYGYIANFVDLVHMALASAPVTTLFIARAVGVFVVPLGVILGFF